MNNYLKKALALGAVAALLAGSTISAAAATEYKVEKGDYLIRIARNAYGDGTLYKRIYDANTDSIKNPDLIYEGQDISIPDDEPILGARGQKAAVFNEAASIASVSTEKKSKYVQADSKAESDNNTGSDNKAGSDSKVNKGSADQSDQSDQSDPLARKTSGDDRKGLEKKGVEGDTQEAADGTSMEKESQGSASSASVKVVRLTVRNKSSYDITQVLIGPAGGTTDGDDNVLKGTLSPGKSVEVEYTPSDEFADEDRYSVFVFDSEGYNSGIYSFFHPDKTTAVDITFNGDKKIYESTYK